MLDFYKGKKVFVTGHTGFKGSWLCKILSMAGAEVTGFSLEASSLSLFNILKLDKHITSVIGDIRSFESVYQAIKNSKADIVFHLAAQPLVKESYEDPIYTYETNVIGTVNLLESVRLCNGIKSVVNITTDKVYENNEWEWGYRENDRLNGYDPYSNSKSCSELVTSSYIKSFFYNSSDTAISTVRAGNVIGGGDFSKDRIVPDCVKASKENQDIIIRNPNSIRPYQHVYEALNAYLLIAQKQYENKEFQGCYNVGPNEEGCVTTASLVKLFCEKWQNTKWIVKGEKDAVHEANVLKLDCSKIKKYIGWQPKISIEKAIELTVKWSKGYYSEEDINKLSEKQIIEYFTK